VSAHAEFDALTDAEKRVASAAVSTLAAQLDLRRVVRVFRALSAGEPLIALHSYIPNAQITLPQRTLLIKSERYWAAAAALVLHMELGETSAERVIKSLGRADGVYQSLIWLTYRCGRMRGGAEISN
jgi:hypothetical protein